MQDVLKGFHHALRLDPTLVEARIRLVRAYLTLSSYGYMRADIAAEQAREQIEIALSVSPAGQTLYPALGWIHVHHDRDFAAASEAFSRSPRCGMDGWSTIYRVRFALGQGRFTEAIGLLRTAMEADPFSPGLHARLTWALHLAGDCEAAVEQARRTQSLFPDYTGAMLFCAIVFAAASRAGDTTGELPTWATAVASRLIHQAPNLDAGYATLAYVQARQGCIIEARAQLDQLQWLSRERFVLRSLQAPALVELGESDAAINALTAAERQHCPWLFELLIDPRLEPLRSEPEFQRLRDLTQVWVSSSESVA
jgi:tetratricopeptide (TPR) repeat protein